MLDSNTALVTELLRRSKYGEAQQYCTSMIYDAYFTMNKAEWINQENKEYRDKTERRFVRYYNQFKMLFDTVPDDVRAQIVMGIKNRMFQEGLLMETMTFEQWINHITSIKTEED
jgi:hypothetical protein